MKVITWCKKNYILVSILLCATVLRFVAVKPGYNQYHGDETAIWGPAIEMVKHSTFDPGRFDYPATAMTMNALAYKYFFIPLGWLKYYTDNFWNIVDGTVDLSPTVLEREKLFELYIVGERAINAIFWARWVTAVFGVGGVYLIYILASKLFSTRVGLLAALFLAFNYRNVVNSHLSLPDVYNAFFVLLSLITSWDLFQRPSAKTYLMAGASAGMAFSTKYQFFSVIPLLFVHLCLLFKGGFSIKKLFDTRFVAAGACVLIVFFLTNPYFFVNLDTVVVKMQEEFKKYAMGTNTLNLYPLSYLYHIDYGPPLFFLAITGFLIAIIKNPIKSLLLLSVIAPSYYVFLYYSKGGFYVRNFIPTTPLLLIFASVGFWQLVGPLMEHFGKKAGIFILLPVLVGTMYVPAKNSILSSYGFTKTWGYDVLRPWMEKNIPKDVVVGVHPFDKSTLGITNRSVGFAPQEEYGLAEFTESGVSYVVVNLNWASLPFYFWMHYDFTDVKELWVKPMRIVRNTYYGLAAEELFRYQVHTVKKPWQSPDTHFVIAKVPTWPQAEIRKVREYKFDTDNEGWETHGLWRENTMDKYFFDPHGGVGLSGSLASKRGGIRFPITRISSEAISVKPGYLYEVIGFLRTDKLLDAKEKDGFLRLDFYGEKINLEEVGLTSSVSSRMYGSTDWIKKKIVDRAPANARYLVVSFQTAGVETATWLDNLAIYESENEVEDITAKFPYTKDFVDLNYLYPNSHGNL